MLSLLATLATAAAVAMAASSPPVQAPAKVVDHSHMGPRIDDSKLMTKRPGYSGPRIQQVTSTDPAYQPMPNNIGVFRVPCDASHMAYDDPIVFPGQKGAAHLHLFFGNTGTSYKSTSKTLKASGNSTCAGGTLNRSAYWVPAMIDTKDGTPLVSTENIVYYKSGYYGLTPQEMKAPPLGLRLVSGNALNTDPNDSGARYICYGVNGENPGWQPTITKAYAQGTCKAGADFVMSLSFPQCWDGVNLDSPKHNTHVVKTEAYQDAQGAWTGRCPTGYPVAIPEVTYNVHYAIPDDEAVSRWRLASDPEGLEAGISGHGDWIMAWDALTIKTWMAGCMNRSVDCHAYLLGNISLGQMLY